LKSLVALAAISPKIFASTVVCRWGGSERTGNFHSQEHRMNKIRMGVAGLALAAMGLLVLEIRGAANADKDLTDAINKVAEAIKKGDKDGASKAADAAAKKFELEDIMHAFKPRKKEGLGVGGNPGAITPDGIEAMILKLKRDVPAAAQVKKDAEALEKMAYQIAALGEITRAKAPEKDSGKKTKKDWVQWSSEQVESGVGLAKAAKAQGAQEIKTAADKVNNSCNACHSIFR